MTLREVLACKLIAWEGDDALVWNYPVEHEDVMKAKRAGGRAGGVKSGEARRKDSLDGASRTPSSTPSTEGKEKEGKEKESPDSSEAGAAPSADADEGQAKGNQKGEPISEVKSEKGAIPGATSAPPAGQGKGEPEAPPAPPPPPDPVVLTFPVVGSTQEWALHESKLAEYRIAFPGAGVDAEVKMARLWCMENPSRRKTAKGMPRFLFAWLERRQNRGRPAGEQRPQSEFSGAF